MDEITRYLLDRQNLRPTTQHNIRVVLEILSKHHKKPVEQLTEDEVKAYLATLSAPNTWNNRFMIIRKFFRWLGRNYLAGMGRKKPEQKIDFLQVTEEHVAWMVSTTDSLRNKALIAVLFECGFRVGEIVSIRIGDVKFDQYGVLIACPKGKTGSRTVRGITCTAILSQWLDSHPLKGNLQAPLFCSVDHRVPALWHRKTGDITARGHAVGDILDSRAVEGMIRRVARLVRKQHSSLPHIHPHIGRHFAATKAAKSGKMNTLGLKQRFGWKSNTMPDIYCHLTGGDAENQYLASNGIIKEDEIAKPTTCPRCHQGNVPGISYCGRCGAPLTEEVAQQLEQKADKLTKYQHDPDILAEIAKQVKAQFLKTLAEDPDVLKAIIGAQRKKGK